MKGKVLHERRQFILRKQTVEHRDACEDDHSATILHADNDEFNGASIENHELHDQHR
jgi:hypothetical protein